MYVDACVAHHNGGTRLRTASNSLCCHQVCTDSRFDTQIYGYVVDLWTIPTAGQSLV